ncbi:MAG: pilus assembly protein N-terminal domain-containing protein [Terracidiphilus sp.]
MRAKTGTIIAYFCALAFVFCAGAGLQAQTSPSPSQPAAASEQDSTNDLPVAVGKTVLVDTQWPIKRVAIGSPEIAEVHGTSATEIMVSGKSVGETNLIVWDTHGGRQFFNVQVRTSASALNDSLDAIRRELRAELPGQSIKVSAENGSILLRGTVKDLGSSSRAVEIAGIGGKVVNLLNVEVPVSDPQILLKVRFISVDRTRETQMGINLVSLGGLNTVGGITTQQYSPPSITNVTPPGPQATFTNELNILAENPGGLPFGVDIMALESKVGGQVLAEPNLLAANGKQASFLAGGEFPFPIVQPGSGGSAPAISIMFKEYGVRLNFIPTITPRRTIRLQVAPEVSSLDFSQGLTISGFDIPAVTTRKVNTEVELADGQSFVIGGMLNNQESDTFNKIPFLGDIPILGRFFQSMQKTKSNTELIVIVTPEIVAPIPAGETLPALKFPAKFLPPNSGIPMNTPDTKTAENTPVPPPPTIPVERLIESMKPETKLSTEGLVGAPVYMTTPGAASVTAPTPTAP